ncbi:VCBS repeat-containing protein [Aneurinibacillus aneurinilyticus]|uniref:VCBS repeat-containing protein n=1 Tax=Aneurinibacillus aneurinilyticus TaxID=1391 RepID=UPI002E2448DB|nr:VCBS repeat-containing protein [Aneurinibacillus aneurinilyticus]
MFVKKGISILCVASITVTGCSLFLPPGDMIKPPVFAYASTPKDEKAFHVVSEFLPPNAEIINPKNAQEQRGIQLKDINGDGKAEIIALYKVKGDEEQHRLIVLQEEEGEGWSKLLDYRAEGYTADFFKFADITNDGKDDILIGWRLGGTTCGLDIFTWKDSQLKKIASDYYSKIELGAVSGPNKKQDDRVAIALWKHDTGEAFEVDVLAWDGTKLAPAPEAYPHYFKKVVLYYEQKVKEMPDAAFYWYYLADAQVKAGQPESGVKSIEKALSIKRVHPSYYPENSQLENVKRAALSMIESQKKEESPKK